MLDGLTTNVIAEILGTIFLSGVSGAFILLFRRIPRDLGQFSRDWSGQSARPGFQAVPGVPQRLERVEQMLEQISHEVNYNSGTSIKDAVHRTDTAVAKLSDDVHTLQATLDRQ